MFDRQFVLVPLLELEPHLKDPVSGALFKSFLDEIKDRHKVEPFL
jgi:7,8-dihydro-6-hydroxymethylpterin-pyrophosphokinase